MINRKFKTVVLASVLLMGSSGFALGGITDSPHDLSALATTGNTNGELCVFCHTPHAGLSVTGGAPLWNKTAPTGASFQMYGATSTATNGSTLATADIGVSDPANASLACLSCHDGVSSIDAIVNAPGAGDNAIVGAKTITDIAVIGNTNAVLGKDLIATHPISIIYTPGNASLRAKDFNMTDAPGNIQAWSGATSIQDLLRGTDDRVECGSCHDPHNGYGTNADAIYGTASTTRATEVNFLRHSNKASALCLGCHDK